VGFTPSLLKKQMTERCSSLVYVACGPPSLHSYCTVMLHSCIILPPVSHSSNHKYHCCQLTRHQFVRPSCTMGWIVKFCYRALNCARKCCGEQCSFVSAVETPAVKVSDDRKHASHRHSSVNENYLWRGICSYQYCLTLGCRCSWWKA
jgi:hypothetical protein